MSAQIFVKNLAGKTITLDVDLLDKVGKLKEQIKDREGIATNEQRLIFGGKQMTDQNTLAFYNIQKHNTIVISLRMLGG